MNAAEVKQSLNLQDFRVFAKAVCANPIPVFDTLTDAELQTYLETKLAAHRAQRGVTL